MEYIKIIRPEDPMLAAVATLYRNAFPKEERREWNELLSMIGTVPEMRLQVIVDGKEEIGFIISWVLNDWCFIEHFALSEKLRGRGYGEIVMKDFMSQYKVLLEIEPPDTKDAIRRLNFYEKIGMFRLHFPYQQPSYREAGVFYKMLLMSNISVTEQLEMDRVLHLVMKQIYFRFQN